MKVVMLRNGLEHVRVLARKRNLANFAHQRCSAGYDFLCFFSLRFWSMQTCTDRNWNEWVDRICEQAEYVKYM